MSGSGGLAPSIGATQNLGPGGGSFANNNLRGGPPTDFKRGDLVWAKVRGYSWWPAKIGDIQRGSGEKRYRVDFIGDNTHQTVNQLAVLSFVDNFQRLSLTKKRDLIEAIDTARKLLKKDEAAILDRKVGKMAPESSTLNKKTSNNEKIMANNGVNEMVNNTLKQDNAGSSNLLKQRILHAQNICAPKPPSCTSKLSTAIANAKTSSEVASELDGTKDSINLLTLRFGGTDKAGQNENELMITPTAKTSRAKKNAQVIKPQIAPQLKKGDNRVGSSKQQQAPNLANNGQQQMIATGVN